MAKLYFKYGTMNSGKSAILLQSAFNYEQKGMKVLVLKPKIDTKGEDYIVSRVGYPAGPERLLLEPKDGDGGRTEGGGGYQCA